MNVGGVVVVGAVAAAFFFSSVAIALEWGPWPLRFERTPLQSSKPQSHS